MTPTKWIRQINAIGIVSKVERYGGIYAYRDIAMSLANHRIYMDAIKEDLISPELMSAQVAYTYADEADIGNGKFK